MNKVTFILPPALLCSPPQMFPHPYSTHSSSLHVLPAVHPLLLELWDAEGQWSHEVVAAGQVPVPHLHRQAAVLVILLQVAGGDTGESFVRGDILRDTKLYFVTLHHVQVQNEIQFTSHCF